MSTNHWLEQAMRERDGIAALAEELIRFLFQTYIGMPSEEKRWDHAIDFAECLQKQLSVI